MENEREKFDSDSLLRTP